MKKNSNAIKKTNNMKQMWGFMTAQYLNCQLYPPGMQAAPAHI